MPNQENQAGAWPPPKKKSCQMRKSRSRHDCRHKKSHAKRGKSGCGMTAATKRVMPNRAKAGRGMTAATKRVMPNEEISLMA